jgi:two-component system, OmpR family, response regulator MtrA
MGTKPTERRAPLRILVIDDDPDLIALCRINLAVGGHDIEEASSGREGLELIASYEPDVVLLDVMMPTLSGLDVLRMIRDDEATRDLPVVIVSARVGIEDQISGKDAGADAYITKPFLPGRLIDTLKQACEARGVLDPGLMGSVGQQPAPAHAVQPSAFTIRMVTIALVRPLSGFSFSCHTGRVHSA